MGEIVAPISAMGRPSFGRPMAQIGATIDEGDRMPSACTALLALRSVAECAIQWLGAGRTVLGGGRSGWDE